MKIVQPVFSIALLLLTIFSFWFYPAMAPVLGMSILAFGLAYALYAIFQKHKHAENARSKITKDILIFLITFLFILILSGALGLFVNHYVGVWFGAVAGFACAMLVSFAVGVGVRKGMMNLSA
ncbi:MAG: hypothetical protein IT310_03230 [Anaerolineales bacterium]|nr:hypothetical protein [Anaerolineales bacterium]